MQHIEFSDMTNRLRRNLMGTAFVIVCIKGFSLEIEEAALSSLKVSGLTTGVAVWVLLALVAYHALAFSIRAFEEYRLWELKLGDTGTRYGWGGGAPLELADNIERAGETLEKITANSGAIVHDEKEILTNTDARLLKELSKAAGVYAKRFENFPRITRFRFWFWDIGLAVAITVAAFGFGLCPRWTGVFLFLA